MIATEKRARLESILPDESVILLFGNREIIRNNDVFYPFRQDSDFLLLTGLSSPDLVLIGKKDKGSVSWTLFSEPISEREILWGTPRNSHDELRSLSGIDDIQELSILRKSLKESFSQARQIFLRQEVLLSEQKEILRGIRIPGWGEKILSPLPLLKTLRMQKTLEEVEKIKKAIQVTQCAYDTIRTNIKPGMYEYEIEALIAGVFRSHHVTEAYPTIVASGPNSCTLHYDRHTRKIDKNDHILIDFGAEYDGYAADITRVFFVGDISVRQRALYEAVIRVNMYAKSLLKPGTKKSVYEQAVRANMNQELIELGLIPKSGIGDEEIERLSRVYYPHSASHFLGLAVHDIGEREDILEPGMIVTCEPGIYIREEGIGIRLEDDILITEDGYENLSNQIPLNIFSIVLA